MSEQNKLILVVVLVSAIITAGCFANTPSTSEDHKTTSLNDSQPNNSMSNDSGPIQAKEVESPPSSAKVIPSNDNRIADVKPIQKVVRRAVEKDGTPRKVGQRLEGEQYRKVSQILKKLPKYNESPADNGYYIKYKGKVIRLNILLEE